MGVLYVWYKCQICPWLYGDSRCKGYSHTTSHHTEPRTARYSNLVRQLGSIQWYGTVTGYPEPQPLNWVYYSHWCAHKPWNRAKLKLKRMRGCHRSQQPSLFRQTYVGERFGRKLTKFWRTGSQFNGLYGFQPTKETHKPISIYIATNLQAIALRLYITFPFPIRLSSPLYSDDDFYFSDLTVWPLHTSVSKYDA